MSQNQASQKFAFVTIVGKTNAGKSTLLNQILGQKVSIVTHKVQTTRRRLLGILTEEETQIAFVDTPGVFEPRKGFEGQLVSTARQAVGEGDMILLLIDASAPVEGVERLVNLAFQANQKIFLVLNKTDKLQKEKLLDVTQSLLSLCPEGKNFDEVFMISALNGDGVADVVAALKKVLPEGQWHFDPEQVTDLPTRVWAAEITREVLFEHLHQELPYGLTVETEAWEETASGIKVHQVIYIERQAHKSMVLGKGGEKVKKIGTTARHRMRDELGCKVSLFLHVKVKPNWKEAREGLDALGLERFNNLED